MNLAQTIANILGMKTGLPFSRGSAGLYALFSAIAKKSGYGEIIIPTLCCETVALAAIYAGHEVRFADVSSETLCVTPETVEAHITSRSRAVVIVHLYGMDAQVSGFAELRSLYPEIAFIEDIAHAIGGSDEEGILLGGSLDYTIASFADSKILPGDGGVILFGSGTLEPENLLNQIPTGASRTLNPRLALSMRNLVHAIADLWRDKKGEAMSSIFLEMIDNYRDLVVIQGSISNEKAVISGIEKLESIRQIRYKNYRKYSTGISSQGVRILSFHQGSNCWRCPLVFESDKTATNVTDALREEGIPASNHYFPLNVLFGAQSCINGENAALRIVNLWVDAKIPLDKVNRTIEIVNRT